MNKKSFAILIILFLSFDISIAQFKVDYKDIDSTDLIDALAFAGIGIYKFDISPVIKGRQFALLLEEYAGKDNLIDIDTLLHFGQFDILSEEITKIRFLTKVVNEKYDTIYLFISMPGLKFGHQIEMQSKFVRKHYFVRFEKVNNDFIRKIPLLFIGSEWDAIYQGKQTTRFCSQNQIPIDLQGDAFDEMPHFYIISYMLK
jgi:hypothetical protein